MKSRLALISCFCIFLSAQIHGQDVDQEVTNHALVDSLWINTDIFASNEPARITLEFDLREFSKKKYEDEYQKAILGFELAEADTVITKEVRIKARGNNRKKRCFFPPIRLNINKSDIDNKFLEDTKKIKLVTHCKNSIIYEKYILKEYLVYKLYNVISPNSFRVRLTRVDYIDTGKKGKDVETWAFLIEPEGLLDERLDGQKIKNDRLSQRFMQPKEAVRMTLFNYMVGNTDYSVTGRHNVKIMMPNDVTTTLGVPIPYDFDYAGIVNATYAVPYEGLGLKSVKERYYLGNCANEAVIPEIIEEFNAKKEALLQVIKDFEHLSEREKQNMMDYLEEFFNMANQRNFIRNNLMSTCIDKN